MSPEDFLDAIRRIADDVAAEHAPDVDAQARFPQETIDALREAGALGAFVPIELGGLGMPFETIAQQMDRSVSATRMLWLRAIDKLKGLYAGDRSYEG